MRRACVVCEREGNLLAQDVLDDLFDRLPVHILAVDSATDARHVSIARYV